MGRTTCPQPLQTCPSPLAGLLIGLKLPSSTQNGHRMMLALICFCSGGRYEFVTDVLWLGLFGDSEITPVESSNAGRILRAGRVTVCTASVIHLCALMH